MQESRRTTVRYDGDTGSVEISVEQDLENTHQLTNEQKIQITERQWLALLSTYGQESTMHGIRYIVSPGSLTCRRYLWLIVVVIACACLTYLVSHKVAYLYTNPKNVDLDFNYNASLPFPAVTICNENPFKLSALLENDLYDLTMVDSVEQPGEINASVDTYWRYMNICHIPSEIRHQRVLNDVPRVVCRTVCSSVYDELCSGFLYSRKNRSCTLSPFTGEPVGRGECTSEDSDGLEFYRRERKLNTEAVLSSFEDGTLGIMLPDYSMPERWSILATTRNKWDITLYKPGSGHYTALSVTHERPGYRARMMTPYMNTTGKCVELFYLIRQKEPSYGYIDDDTHIRIVAIDEELAEKVIAVSHGWDDSDFQRLFKRLPDGVHRVAVDGVRGISDKGHCGISLDDVTIMDCDIFELEKECMSHPRGLFYLGSTNISENGKPCSPWTNTKFEASLPDENPADAANLCRLVPGQNWNRPSCIVSTVRDHHYVIEECDIPYCGANNSAMKKCRQDSHIQCDDGMCLPREISCTGIEYCLDGSTSKVLCGGATNQSCSFEEAFICGYKTPAVGDVSWERVAIDELKHLEDFTENANGGHAMVLKSVGSYGDRVSLISPVSSMSCPIFTTLKFRFYVSKQDNDVGGNLEVIVLSEHKVPLWTVFNANTWINTAYNWWNELTVTIPLTKYNFYLEFVAEIGKQFASDVILDEIRLECLSDNGLRNIFLRA